jgi:hypothetical protein
MRINFDAQTLWTLSGVAFRIAQRIGLHREDKTGAFTPFELELRRRLWRQLMILDHTSCELAGSSPNYSMLSRAWDAPLPLNVNDSDLDPDMAELPPEREGATEMIFCALRCEFSSFFLHISRGTSTAYDTFSTPSHSIESSIAVKDGVINELQQKLEQKFLRFCDPLNPLHSLTCRLRQWTCVEITLTIHAAIAARAAICGMRLRAHHPRQYPDGGASLPQSEKDMLFSLSLQIMQYDSLAYTNKSLQGYHWHIIVYFQWHALIYLLSELRSRKMGDEADKGWDQIEDSFHHHPEIIGDRDYALYSAVRLLALKSWEDREAEFRELRIPLQTPEFITKLRATTKERTDRTVHEQLEHIPMCMAIREETDAKQQRALPYNMLLPWMSNESENPRVPAEDLSVRMADITRISEIVPASNEPSPVDWEQWDAMIHSMDLPAVDLDSFFK